MFSSVDGATPSAAAYRTYRSSDSSGFASGETVLMDLDGQPVAVLVANGSGLVSEEHHLPAFANGTHLLRLRGASSRTLVTTTVTHVGGITATPSGAVAGVLIPIVATGFAPGEPVTLTIGTDTFPASSDASGMVSGEYPIPPGPPRPVALILVGESGVRRSMQLVRL